MELIIGCILIVLLLKEFTRSEKKFYHKGEVHSFTISLGYAQYPQQAKNYDGLMHCADAAVISSVFMWRSCYVYGRFVWVNDRQEGRGHAACTGILFANIFIIQYV